MRLIPWSDFKRPAGDARIILGTMTPEELDFIKRALKQLRESSKETWLEKQLLRNLIIDSGWMPERELDLAIERGKAHPANVRQTDETWADSEQTLAEMGLSDWLADFDKRYPRSE
jgi:hypothetical protein